MEKTLVSRTVFDGKLLCLEVINVEVEPGIESVREVVRHPGAVVLLPQLPDGRFVLVRQFRKAIEEEILEAVAGTLDPGEEPLSCAGRELAEETGYVAAELHNLGTMFPAPGYTDECLHVFFARLTGESVERCPDEDERIENVLLAESEIEDLIADGEVRDAKTLGAWMLLKGRRPELVLRGS
jgi:ADP-ribose pyrophosphatase